MEPQGILPEPLMLIVVVAMAPEATQVAGLEPVLGRGQARTGLQDPDQATAQVGLLQGLPIAHLAEARVQAVEV